MAEWRLGFEVLPSVALTWLKRWRGGMYSPISPGQK